MKPNGWYTGIVSLWDLPEDKVYIDLKPTFKRTFLDSIKRDLSWRQLAVNIGFSYKILEHFRGGHRISLNTLHKILEYCKKYSIDVSKDVIEINISRIGGQQSEILNPKLPFNFNSEDGTKIIAACLNDGGLKSRSYIFFYTNTQLEKRREIATAVKRIFGTFNINMKREIVDFLNIVGMVLSFGIGLDTGQKVINNPRIPEFIFKLKENVIASYLRQAFDDDGYVCCGKLHNHKLIGITSNTASKQTPPISTLLLDTKDLLKIVGINSQNVHKSKQRPKVYKGMKYISQEWKLLISGIYSLSKFQKVVNFGLKYKRDILKKIISELKKASISLHKPHGLSEEEAEEIVTDTINNISYIDKHLLASKMNISAYWAKELLKRLENKQLIKPVRNRKSTSPNKFILKDSIISPSEHVNDFPPVEKR